HPGGRDRGRRAGRSGHWRSGCEPAAARGPPRRRRPARRRRRHADRPPRRITLMPAWLAGWAARWRALRAGGWLPRAAALGQWALVATVALAMVVQTAGYLGRLRGSGRALHDVG